MFNNLNEISSSNGVIVLHDSNVQYAHTALRLIKDNIDLFSDNQAMYVHIPVLNDSPYCRTVKYFVDNPTVFLDCFIYGNGDVEGTEAIAKSDPNILLTELQEYAGQVSIDFDWEDSPDSIKEFGYKARIWL